MNRQHAFEPPAVFPEPVRRSVVCEEDQALSRWADDAAAGVTAQPADTRDATPGAEHTELDARRTVTLDPPALPRTVEALRRRAVTPESASASADPKVPGIPWWALHATLVVVVLFVPIRRYHFPNAVGFELEPYRIVLALLLGAWLADRTQRHRPARVSGLSGPVFLLVLTLLASELANVDRIANGQLQAEVIKSLSYIAGFLLMLPLLHGTLRGRADVDRVLAALVMGGTLVAALGIVEYRTGWNAFNHLGSIVPGLGRPWAQWLTPRSGRLRVIASSQHPIALGALFALILPFCLYLAQRRVQRRWLVYGGIVLLAMLGTVSRTAVLMLGVEVIVLFWLRPNVRRFWPLAIPFLLAAHVALPGTLGAFKAAFFPSGGLIAEQQAGNGSTGSGRLAHLGPSLDHIAAQPLVGDGFGTRIVDDPARINAPILDDQWLGLLLDVGVAGAFAFFWLVSRHARHLIRACRASEGADAMLLAALASAALAYAIGMATFDALAFVQVTFVFFVLIGLGRVVIAERQESAA